MQMALSTLVSHTTAVICSRCWAVFSLKPPHKVLSLMVASKLPRRVSTLRSLAMVG